MKIVHLNTERTWRGGERQLFLLANGLKKNGHEVWVACRAGAPLMDQALKAGLPVFPLRPWGELDFLSALLLRRLLRLAKADILHAHTGSAVGLGALAVGGLHTRLVATRRVDFPLSRGIWTKWKYGKCDSVVAISEAVRDVMKKSLPATRDIPVIYSAVDQRQYPSAADKKRLRFARGLDEGPLVVNVGALVPHKDQASLVEAAALVIEAIPTIQFLILGEGELRAELISRIEGKGLANKVKLLGQRPDVLECIALADVFVSSSCEEGLGTTLLDALAVGVPTVATRAGGVPEIYGDSQAPELVPVRSPAALAQNIVSVLQNPAEAAARVLRGRVRVKRFLVDRMIARYEDIYHH